MLINQIQFTKPIYEMIVNLLDPAHVQDIFE